jgi:serine/threonine protein kinase
MLTDEERAKKIRAVKKKLKAITDLEHKVDEGRRQRKADPDLRGTFRLNDEQRKKLATKKELEDQLQELESMVQDEATSNWAAPGEEVGPTDDPAPEPAPEPPASLPESQEERMAREEREELERVAREAAEHAAHMKAMFESAQPVQQPSAEVREGEAGAVGGALSAGSSASTERAKPGPPSDAPVPAEAERPETESERVAREAAEHAAHMKAMFAPAKPAEAEKSKESAAEPAAVAEPAADDPEVLRQKKIRALNKKLKAIDDLQAKMASGVALNQSQVSKLKSRAGLQQELNALEAEGDAPLIASKPLKVPRLKLQASRGQTRGGGEWLGGGSQRQSEPDTELSPRSDVSFGGNELFSDSSRDSSPQDDSERGSDRTPKAALDEMIEMSAMPSTPVDLTDELDERAEPLSNGVQLSDFEVLHVVGQGGFGKVMQVRKVNGGQEGGQGRIFALKAMSKTHIVGCGEVNGVKTEARVLRKIRHPFVVRLHYAFQTETKLYLVMDFINGGQIFYHLRKVGFFQEPQARFYASELLLALSHLHEHSIVHRDLKPENLLLDRDGHLILTDFGCAKEAGIDGNSPDVDGLSTTSFTGTEAYMAPEIVELLLATKEGGQPVDGDDAATRELRKRRSYGIAVDWWAFGCLLHQMLTGDIPFYANNIKTMRKNILTAKLKFAKFLSAQAISLLKLLLVADPAKRLGSDIRKENVPRSPGTVAAGGRAVRAHAFFDGINWDRTLEKKMPPPFVPSVTGPMDIGNIDEKYTLGFPAIDSPVSSPHALSPSKSALFSGFSYDGSPGRFSLLASDSPSEFRLDGLPGGDSSDGDEDIGDTIEPIVFERQPLQRLRSAPASLGSAGNRDGATSAPAPAPAPPKEPTKRDAMPEENKRERAQDKSGNGNGRENVGGKGGDQGGKGKQSQANNEPRGGGGRPSRGGGGGGGGGPGGAGGAGGGAGRGDRRRDGGSGGGGRGGRDGGGRGGRDGGGRGRGGGGGGRGGGNGNGGGRRGGGGSGRGSAGGGGGRGGAGGGSGGGRPQSAGAPGGRGGSDGRSRGGRGGGGRGGGGQQ